LSTKNPTCTDLGMNRASAMRGQPLTAWAMAQPMCVWLDNLERRIKAWIL
jgi:hypothetical protein